MNLTKGEKDVLSILNHFPGGLDEVEVSRELIGSLNSSETESLLTVASVNEAMFRLRKIGLVNGSFMGYNRITRRGFLALTGA